MDFQSEIAPGFRRFPRRSRHFAEHKISEQLTVCVTAIRARIDSFRASPSYPKAFSPRSFSRVFLIQEKPSSRSLVTPPEFEDVSSGLEPKTGSDSSRIDSLSVVRERIKLVPVYSRKSDHLDGSKQRFSTACFHPRFAPVFHSNSSPILLLVSLHARRQNMLELTHMKVGIGMQSNGFLEPFPAAFRPENSPESPFSASISP